MKAIRSALIVATSVLALAFPAGGASAPPQPPASTFSAADVRQAVGDYFTAFRTKDIATIDRLLSADYTLIGVNGEVRGRVERLAWLRANLESLGEITPSDLVVRQYGEVAVVTGIVTIPDGGQRIYERFTQVWVFSAGSLRMVSGQITAVTPEFAPRASRPGD